MSMDIDTALFTILRKDDRGLHGLRLVARAARINKKSVSLTQSSSAPLMQRPLPGPKEGCANLYMNIER